MLLRQELAGVESDVALCERCFGPERRFCVRYARPASREGVLVLVERAPRSVLASEQRMDLRGEDEGTRFLAELLRHAGIREEHVLLGAAVMCRPASRRLESAVGVAVCVRECAVHVRELVRVAAPRLVIPLGKAALRSLRWAFANSPAVAELRFPESVGRLVDAGAFGVYPLYHVTRRARLHRSPEEQRRDWRHVGRILGELLIAEESRASERVRS